MAEAMARLRAYAYGEDRTLAGDADDVVERRLRFDRLGDCSEVAHAGADLVRAVIDATRGAARLTA